jgi:hypothetical protein
MFHGRLICRGARHGHCQRERYIALHYATPEFEKDGIVLIQGLLGGPRERYAASAGAIAVCVRSDNSRMPAATMTGMVGILAGSATPVPLRHWTQDESGSLTGWLCVASSTCEPSMNSRASAAKKRAAVLLLVAFLYDMKGAE